MISNERIQEIFEAVKLHFTSKSYDFTKYSGKLKTQPRVNPATSYIFSKIKDEGHIIYYMVANQIQYYSENGRYCTYLPEIIGDKNYSIYENFLLRLKTVEINTYSDFESLYAKGEFKKLSDIDAVLGMFYSGKLSLFSIIHLYKFTKMSERWKKTADPLAENFLQCIEKLSPFLQFKKEIFLKIMKKVTVQ